MSNRISGIILGAGTSSRFAGNKLVALIDGTPVIGHVLEAALTSRLGRIALVVGYESQTIEMALGKKLGDARVELVRIDNYEIGQSRAVIAGLEAIWTDSTAAMYLMGDQPFLTSGIINSLISTFKKSQKAICYPSIDGKRRNPVIFGAKFFPDIRAIKGDTGARAIIDSNPDQTIALAFDDERPFLDIDTPAEYQKLVR